MSVKRFEVVINEFDEVEYIMDKAMMEDRDFAEFIEFVEDVCKENEQLKKENEWLKQSNKNLEKIAYPMARWKGDVGMTDKRFTIKHYESQDWAYDNGTYIDTRMIGEYFE